MITYNTNEIITLLNYKFFFEKYSIKENQINAKIFNCTFCKYPSLHIISKNNNEIDINNIICNSCKKQLFSSMNVDIKKKKYITESFDSNQEKYINIINKNNSNTKKKINKVFRNLITSDNKVNFYKNKLAELLVAKEYTIKNNIHEVFHNKNCNWCELNKLCIENTSSQSKLLFGNICYNCYNEKKEIFICDDCNDILYKNYEIFFIQPNINLYKNNYSYCKECFTKESKYICEMENEIKINKNKYIYYSINKFKNLLEIN